MQENKTTLSTGTSILDCSALSPAGALHELHQVLRTSLHCGGFGFVLRRPLTFPLKLLQPRITLAGSSAPPSSLDRCGRRGGAGGLRRRALRQGRERRTPREQSVQQESAGLRMPGREVWGPPAICGTSTPLDIRIARVEPPRLADSYVVDWAYDSLPFGFPFGSIRCDGNDTDDISMSELMFAICFHIEIPLRRFFKVVGFQRKLGSYWI